MLLLMQALVELNLAENRLKELPEQMDSMTALRTCWLYANMLTSIPLYLLKAPSLKGRITTQRNVSFKHIIYRP